MATDTRELNKVRKFLKFIPTAEGLAEQSKDPSTKVGAIALDDDFNVRSVGYNGFPRGVDDNEAYYADRETKYKRISHAEMNVVAQAARTGVSINGCTLLLTSLFPCSTCAKILIQAGIRRILAPNVKMGDVWRHEWEISKQLCKEAKVRVYGYNPLNPKEVQVII
ncbi:deaminase [Oligella sp. HMSC09E12]|uniref:deaminase n=1 Tax=Oligella sp. HMSC09E12 TaxID=1581147 RepID=UPI0008A1C973|nr:deaminase [Oligella sp. HMSC09E12]OFV49746.1 hypothetical protein HMPREF3179_03810 [Oligella sp. HMSC09E12]